MSLKNFLNLRIQYVSNEVMIVLKDILRKYPDLLEEFLSFLSRSYLDQVIESDGKAALVWILGRFGDKIEDSPYIMEKIIEEEQDVGSLKLQSFIVVAITQLFFKRAPEMQVMLSNYYKSVMKNSNDTDLRQKVIFYYRLMQQDLTLAR